MRRRVDVLLALMLVAIDAVMINLAFYLSYRLRFQIDVEQCLQQFSVGVFRHVDEEQHQIGRLALAQFLGQINSVGPAQRLVGQCHRREAIVAKRYGGPQRSKAVSVCLTHESGSIATRHSVRRTR